MMNQRFLAAVAAASLACVLAPMALACYGSAAESSDQGGPGFSALELEREVRGIAARTRGGNDLWPGFEILSVPLAVFDGETTYLFRHLTPPADFEPEGEGEHGAHMRPGRHEAVFADSIAEIGGEVTATLLMDGPRPEQSLKEIAAAAVHETFHAFQHHRHPGWVVNVAALFTYPIDQINQLEPRLLETKAFRRAWVSKRSDEAACWVRTALAQRQDRHARIGSLHAEYEHALAKLEGTAFYLERLAAGNDPVNLPKAGFLSEQIRRHAYETGAAMAGLLDRFDPNWKQALSEDDEQSLDELLRAAIDNGERCEFDEEMLAAVANLAKSDIERLLAVRGERLDQFKARPGWKVVVEGGQDSQLFVRQIDPVNIESLGGQRVLHTRSVRLGNDKGQLEVTNELTVTEGAGSHPLFEGVRRVVLTGLAKPDIHEQGDSVMLESGGLRVEFSSVVVEQSGHTVTLVLH